MPIRDAEGMGSYVSEISLEMIRSDNKLAGWSNLSYFEPDDIRACIACAARLAPCRR